MARQTSYVVPILLATLWCGLLFLPPIVASLEAPSTEVSLLLYGFFSPICHQDDVRSLHILGFKLGVCARCSSIYFGFLAGCVIAAIVSVREKQRFGLWFAAILLPMLLDVVLDALGLHQTTMFTRASTGLMFGVGSGMLLAPVFVQAFIDLSTLGQRNSHAKA